MSQLTNWLVAFATPIFLARSSYGPYFLYGFLCLGCVAVLAVTMRETKGQPLEAIEEAFKRPVPFLTSFLHHVRRLAGSSEPVEVAVVGRSGPTLEGVELADVKVEAVHETSDDAR